MVKDPLLKRRVVIAEEAQSVACELACHVLPLRHPLDQADQNRDNFQVLRHSCLEF